MMDGIDKEIHTSSTRARLARSLRSFAGVRGWQRFVNWFVPSECAGLFRVSNNGRVFEGDLKSFIDRNVYLFGGYENQQINLFLSNVPIRRRGIALDIGANVGTHALAFAEVFREVHSFEPNSLLWAQFEKNMVLNSCDIVILHKIGLGDEDSERPFYMIEKENYGLGTFSAKEQYDLPLKQVGVAKVAHAAHYLTAHNITSVDAVKIDVQGFEMGVLRGLAPVLQRDMPIVWVELSADTLGQAVKVHELNRLFSYPFEAKLMGSKMSPYIQAFSTDLVAGDYIIVPRPT